LQIFTHAFKIKTIHIEKFNLLRYGVSQEILTANDSINKTKEKGNTIYNFQSYYPILSYSLNQFFFIIIIIIACGADFSKIKKTNRIV